jgi:hypothetical protein
MKQVLISAVALLMLSPAIAVAQPALNDPIQILSQTTYASLFGGVVVRGELQNTAATQINGFHMTVSAFAPDGTVADTAQVYGGDYMPDEVGPYDITLKNADLSDRFDVSADSSSPWTTRFVAPAPTSNLHLRHAAGSDSLVFSGIVTNPTDAPATVQLEAWFVDDQDRVLDVEYSWFHAVQAGAGQPFAVTASPRYDPQVVTTTAARVRAVAQHP